MDANETLKEGEDSGKESGNDLLRDSLAVNISPSSDDTHHLSSAELENRSESPVTIDAGGDSVPDDKVLNSEVDPLLGDAKIEQNEGDKVVDEEPVTVQVAGGEKIDESTNKSCGRDEESNSDSEEFADLEDTKPVPGTGKLVSDEFEGSIDKKALLEELMVPEYDSQLNHVFFAKKSLCQEDRVKEEELRLKFFSTYKAFFNNREDLVNTLRDIADEAVQVQRNCNISHIVGGSVGIAGGASALIGTIAFPPLLFGGLVVAGVATVSNLGTTITQFVLFRNLVQSAVQKSKYDDGLMESLEDVYKSLIFSNLFNIEEHSPTGEINKDFSLAKLQLGLDGAKSGALALGVRSVGIGMVEFGSSLLRGVARGAMGIGVVIDGVTIYISAYDLAKGSSTKLSDALRKLADQKQAELDKIKKRVDSSGLFDICKKDLDTDESRFVLSRSTMASVL